MKIEDIHPETPTEFLLCEICKALSQQNQCLAEILKELKKEENKDKKKGK